MMTMIDDDDYDNYDYDDPVCFLETWVFFQFQYSI